MINIDTRKLYAVLAARPCSEQWDLVEFEWPNTIPLTEDTIARARYLGLDLVWLGGRLPEPARAEYQKVRDTARAEYQKVRDTAYAEYEKVRDTARAEYEKVCDTARAEYQKVRDTAYAEYEKVRDTAYAEYDKVRDTALLAALIRLAEGL